jgi:hypothetical protein
MGYYIDSPQHAGPRNLCHLENLVLANHFLEKYAQREKHNADFRRYRHRKAR